MAYDTEPVEVENLTSEDIIIVMMGVAGSGKSQVMATLIGESTRAGFDLEPSTQVVANRVVGHPTYGNNLVLVDTPGLDRAPEEVGDWMARTYRQGVPLPGIIYVHPITAVRMDENHLRTLRMFEMGFGNKHARNVMVLTTRWDEVMDTEEAEQHETELKENHWNVMISRGATYGRFYINEQSGPGSPWMITNEMIQRYLRAPAYETRYIRAGNLKSDDIVIVLIGPAGSGKSQVIDTLTGQNTRARRGVIPGTTEVSAYRVLGHREYRDKLVLVDTPGFENRSYTYLQLHSPGSENRSNIYFQILGLLERWGMRRPKRYTGIICTYPITAICMPWVPHRDLPLFRTLCDDEHMSSMVLLTTMRDKVRGMEEAMNREADLERYAPGCYRLRRFDVSRPELLWATVNEIATRHR